MLIAGEHEDVYKIIDEFHEKMNSEILPNSGRCEYDFLHGNSQYFALVLANKLNYNIMLSLGFDPETKQKYLVHAWNVVDTDEGKKYIDVRGAFNNLDDILSEFDYLGKPEFVEVNKDDAINILSDMGINSNNDNLTKDAEILAYKNKEIYVIN